MPSGSARKRHDGNTDMLLAAERAVDLGALLLRQGRGHMGALIPKGDRDYATDVDVRIEEAMRAALDGVLPGVSFLGEEEGDDGAGSAKWVLDPIDGTINFMKGSPLCSISLALLRDGQPVFGIVDLPLLGERYVARSGVGAFLNGDRIFVTEVPALRDAMVALTDFAVGVPAKAENEIHLRLLARLQRESLRVRVHGSEALDLAWLAAGRLNASVMLSNIPWDVSAGVLLVREAGGEVLDYDGSSHGLDSRFTIASTPSLAEPLRLVVNESL
jgi:myo-inositol-1(or 4)-monophosphatase